MSGIVGSRLNHRGSGLVGSIGTDGQALTSSGAGVGMVFEAAAGGTDNTSFQVQRVAAQEIANTSATKIEYDTTDFDTASGWDGTNFRYVVQTADAGKWLFAMQIQLRTSTDSEGAQQDLFKNGTHVKHAGRWHPRFYDTLQYVYLMDLSAGDYIHIQVWHSTGSAVDVGASALESTVFGGVFLEA